MAIGKVLRVQPQKPEGYKGYVFGRIHGCSNGSFERNSEKVLRKFLMH